MALDAASPSGQPPARPAAVIPAAAVLPADPTADPGVAPAAGWRSGPLGAALADLVHALAEQARGRTATLLLALTWVVILFGPTRVGGWLESAGWATAAKIIGLGTLP